MALPLFLCFAFFNLAVGEQKNNYNAKGWADAGHYLTQYMDRSISPCTDFHGFVCANYGNKTDDTYQKFFTLRYRDLMKTTHDAVQHVNLNDQKTPEYARVVRKFYDECNRYGNDKFTTNRVYELIRNTLGEFPAFDGGSSNNVDIWYAMGQMRQKLGVDMALKVGFFGPFESITAVKPDKKFPFQTFRNRTLAVAEMIGKEVNHTHLDVLLDEAELLYNDWKGISVKKVSYFTIAKSYLTTTNGKLSKNVSTMNWNSYFRGLLPSYVFNSNKWNSSHVAVLDPHLVEEVGKIFAKHPKRAVMTLMYGKAFTDVLANWILALDSPFLEEIVEAGHLETTTSLACLAYMLQYMSAPASRVYFDYIGIDPMRWREEVRMTATNVFQGMRLLLNSISYIGPKSKQRMNRKIDAIDVEPAVPSWIMNDTIILEDSDSYTFNSTSSLLEKIIAIEQQEFLDKINKWFSYKQNFSDLVSDKIKEIEEIAHRKTGNPTDLKMLLACIYLDIFKYEEPDGPPNFELNSMFLPCFLRIKLYLGYNLPPILQPNYPLAVKYGGHGFVIGHELMHAFDTTGITVAGPDDKKLLEENEQDVYDKQVGCLVQSYDQYCYKELGACINSTNSISENIADIGGLKATFAAYQAVKAVLPEEPAIPGLENFTDDQVFFIAFQRQLCTRNLPSLDELNDDHTTDEARATMALRNAPHFAAAFSCPVGSPAAPLKQCDFWGDIYGTGKEHK